MFICLVNPFTTLFLLNNFIYSKAQSKMKYKQSSWNLRIKHFPKNNEKKNPFFGEKKISEGNKIRKEE